MDIENISLGGFAKNYWQSDYAVLGNRNQANAMRNYDLRNPHYAKPGPGLLRLTNGDESGVLGTLCLRIMPRAFAADETYGVAGKVILKITSTAVTADHTLNTGELGVDAKLTDITEYRDDLFYVCDRATANKATLGRRAGATYDDDYLERSAGATTGTFSLTYGVPHKLLVASNDRLYITNGNKISSYNAATDIGTVAAIDLPEDAVATDIESTSQKLIITVNWPNLTGDNRTLQRIFIWNRVDETWDDDVPQVRKSGALYTKEGITFIFYEDITADGGGRLGILDGMQIKELAQWNGSLPHFYQVDEKEGFIVWVSRVGSEDLIFCWGAENPQGVPRVFQLAKGKYDTIGAIGLPFASLMIASENGGSGGDNLRTDLSQESGYTNDAYFYSLDFPISLDLSGAMIKKAVFAFEQLQAGAGVEIGLRDRAGTLFRTMEISYDALGRRTKETFPLTERCEDFRYETRHSRFSSTTTIVLLRNAKFKGYAIN